MHKLPPEKITEFYTRIKSIRLELSGMCPLSKAHSHKCPNIRGNGCVTLGSDLIYRVLGAFPKSWQGEIGFHMYNDPSVDPRLFLIASKVRSILPAAFLDVWSNGLYLTPTLIQEGIDIGIDKFHITAYSDDVYNMVYGLQGVVVNRRQDNEFDDRLTLYTREKNTSPKICLAPFNQLIINRYGKIGLCCFDWGNSITFGDLYTESLEDCFERMDGVFKNLMDGKREYEACSRCNTGRMFFEETPYKDNGNKVCEMSE